MSFSPLKVTGEERLENNGHLLPYPVRSSTSFASLLPISFPQLHRNHLLTSPSTPHPGPGRCTHLGTNDYLIMACFHPGEVHLLHQMEPSPVRSADGRPPTTSELGRGRPERGAPTERGLGSQMEN